MNDRVAGMATSGEDPFEVARLETAEEPGLAVVDIVPAAFFDGRHIASSFTIVAL